MFAGDFGINAERSLAEIDQRPANPQAQGSDRIALHRAPDLQRSQRIAAVARTVGTAKCSEMTPLPSLSRCSRAGRAGNTAG